jgi:hypothetical protein
VLADNRAATSGLAHPSGGGSGGVVERDRAGEVPRTVDAEVNVQGIPRIEFEEQVLSDGVRANDGVTVDPCSIPESTLWARHSASRANKVTRELPRDAVDGMTLGHV